MSVTRYDLDGNADGYFDDPFMKVRENGKFVLHSDYAALLARHNVLEDAARVALIDWRCCIVTGQSDAYDTLAALREAVAWERECIRQLDYVARFWDDDNLPGRELIMILDAARAEVDRLLDNGGSNE